MTAEPAIERLDADILILGAGGAGLCAALHAADRSPRLSVTVVVKGLLGRAGCTRMVQGGYNAVLTAPDSLAAHFLDTLAGGGWINDQELVWTLVVESPGRVLGRDLARGPVEVGPTTHFMMGGVVVDTSCRTAIDGLFAAGEDTGGVHGANRLGGNGVAESTVFGGIAGDVMAEFVAGRARAQDTRVAVGGVVER